MFEPGANEGHGSDNGESATDTEETKAARQATLGLAAPLRLPTATTTAQTALAALVQVARGRSEPRRPLRVCCLRGEATQRTTSPKPKPTTASSSACSSSSFKPLDMLLLLLLQCRCRVTKLPAKRAWWLGPFLFFTRDPFLRSTHSFATLFFARNSLEEENNAASLSVS